MSAAPEVVVSLDEHWVAIPVDAREPAEAARAVLDEALQNRGVTADLGGARALYEGAYADVVTSLRARVAADPGSFLVGAYALLAPTDPLPATVAELWAVAADLPGVDALADELVVPAAQRFGEPLVSTLATAAGQAVRVQQLLVRPDHDGQAAVRTSLSWVWAGPTPSTWLLMSAVFGSPVDAELLAERCDRLAASVTLRPPA